MKSFFAAITRNPLSLLGVAITTASSVVFLSLFGIEMSGFHGNPYLGIIAYLVVPAVFVVGLILIPIGVGRERQKLAGGGDGYLFPVYDLNQPSTRRRFVVFFGLTAVNCALLVIATYNAVETMESVEFCGTTCHTVMQPEYTAFNNSPHAGSSCVECHIGPGANWFVKSKLSGAWQVISVAFNLYERPIPTPVHQLRPARETCEQCHWPAKFVGDRLRVMTSYDDDEDVTELKTVLLMRVGGVRGGASPTSHGIHWHVDPGVQIRYLSDPDRLTIYDVERRNPDGEVTLFKAETEPEGEAEWRTMDCIDCHNRPTHIYKMPERAIDEAIYAGAIPQDLPYVRREAVAAIQEPYDSHTEARTGIAASLRAFYQENYPELLDSRAEDIAKAIQGAGDAYAKNVFPQMNVNWGTYPNHLNHTDFDGCFRCHDDLHESEDGEAISGDCDLCHSVLAEAEEEPEILDQLSP
jgi:hypothetical protein